MAFRYRGYTPLPFLLLAVVFAEPTLSSLGIGFGIVVAGEMLRIRAVRAAGYETRSTKILTGRTLVTKGPYARVRNPLYMTNLIIYFGIGVMSMALFPWLLLGALAWFMTQYHLIVRYEEEFLEQLFGDRYRRYRDSVNRFIPGRRASLDGEADTPSLDLLSGLRSERRTIQAEFIVTLLLVGIYTARGW